MSRLLNKEQFMTEFGYDPTPDIVPVEDEGGGVADHLKSAAVGLAAAAPVVIGLPEMLYAGGKAAYDAYGTDKTFGEEFSKNVRVEGSDENVQKHIGEVVQSWRSQDPSLTNEDIQKGLQDYSKSKLFEDFMTEQLSGRHWLTAKTKQAARSLLGDERPESKRSWTESAAEVLGGALVGGPAGWVGKAATIPGLAGVAANPIGRAAIRTAEAVTPLTMPYTPTNIGINAAAGVAIDQGLRYAQGQSTAFTPTKEDPNSVGTLAAGGAGIIGAVAFANAIRGRTSAAMQAIQANPTHVQTTLQNMPSLDDKIRPELRPGEAFMISGDPRQSGPPSALANMPVAQSARRRLRGQTMDTGAELTAQIRDIHTPKVAEDLEILRTSNSGVAMRDAVDSDTSNSIRPIYDAFQSISPEKSRAYQPAWFASSYASDIDTVIARNQAELAKLHTQLPNAQTPQAQVHLQTQITKLQDDLARMARDDPSTRIRLPKTPVQQIRDLADALVNDMSPEAVRVKDAIKNFNREMLDVAVKSQKMKQQSSDDLHARNPLYVQATNDPLLGKVGGDRLYASVAHEINQKVIRQSEGSGGAAAHQGPLRHLDKDIGQIRGINDPETRITAPLNVISAAANYARQMHLDAAHTLIKNEHIRHLAYKDAVSIPSDFLRDGHMRPILTPQGKEWWSEGLLHQPEVHAHLSKHNVVDEWNNGEVRLWEFGDPEYARALRFEPAVMTGLMKGIAITTNLMKSLTTGRGAPWFIFKGPMYDMPIAILTRQADRVFGPVSTRVDRYLPEWFSKPFLKYVPDVSAYAAMPWHIVASVSELTVLHSANALVRYLPSEVPGFAVLRNAVGPQRFAAMMRAAVRVADIANNTPSARLERGGATRGGAQVIDHVPVVRKVYDQFNDRMPTLAKAAWQFYKDVLDAFYTGPKRQYYTQNYAREYYKNGGHVPEETNKRLIAEARRMAGDMTLTPASKTARDFEVIFPYLTQTKLGAYHLIRNMMGKETASYMLPRLGIALYGVSTSFYMMTHWNEESRKLLWHDTPEHDRYRYLFIPHPKLVAAWAMGQDLPFSRDLVYKIPIAPDLAGIVAGTVAFLQMTGAIPADATPKPISRGDVFDVIVDSITPAMPPAFQAMAGLAGYKIDPQSSDTRGGNWIRNVQPSFRSGPQSEAASNLGQISNSTSLVLNALFGGMGMHIATGTDIALHAAKFHPRNGDMQSFNPRESMNFGAGLRAATTEVFSDIKARIPDIPLLWKAEERKSVTTPSWKYVRESMNHVNSIVGMRSGVDGKASQLEKAQATRIGGVAKQQLTDVALINISREITQWHSPTGPLGKLQAENKQLSRQASSVRAAYDLPQDRKRALINEIVTKQQANMVRQQQSVQLAEQYIAQKYGQALAPKLGGRVVDMATLDRMLRESIGTPNLVTDSQE